MNLNIDINDLNNIALGLRRSIFEFNLLQEHALKSRNRADADMHAQRIASCEKTLEKIKTQLNIDDSGVDEKLMTFIGIDE